MAEFLDLETQDAVRMPWNVLPGTKQEAAQCVIPISAIYTPIKPLPNTTPLLPYSPLRCRNCRSVLNPFSIVDFSTKIWICSFCLHRNHFPLQYQQSISEDNLPAELFHQYTTIEYEPQNERPTSQVIPQVFFFVVDTCMIEEEIGYLRSGLSRVIGEIPENSLVGLITFGRYVCVHELGFFGKIPKVYVFNGTKEITKDQVLEQMGFFLKKPRPATGVVAGVRDGLSQESISRFLLPAAECEFALNSVLDELQKDPWPVPADQRAPRCTGTALTVAAHLLGVCVPGSGARIMAFLGGPATEGPGSIVSKALSEPIRSHKDLDKDDAPYFHKAVKLYEGLTKQLIHQGHVLDVFACALDQVGVAELKIAVEKTGGLVVLAESFGHSVFKDSLLRVFQSGDNDLGLSSKFLHKVCWLPIRIQYMMRSQGIKGPSYRFLHGNTKEIYAMRTRSMGRPMDHLSHEIFPRILPHVHSWVNLYGRNFLNWYGAEAQLVVTEPQLIKEILYDKDGVYPKIDLEGHAKKLLGDGLSSTKGDKWTKLRKIANGVFHGESLKSMIPAMISSSETMLERWKKAYDGKEIEVFQEFRVLTSEVVSKTAFGSSYLEGKKIFDMLIKLTLIVSRNAHNIRLPGISGLFKNDDDIESEKLELGIKKGIVEIIQKREQETSSSDSKKDFLGELLEASRDNDEEKRISLDDMVDECKTLYFAGHETTTSLLGWTVLLLAVHSDWQEKARDEVFEFCGKTNPTPDSITRLKTMSMIVEESLRLYPPVPAIKRKVKKEVRLGAMTLPRNMELYISPLAVHHDPIIWGSDVHMFKPERFEGGIAKATNNTLAAFLPFGFGPRTCVGLNFALVEAKIALVMILQRFKFKLSSNYVHSPVQLFMVRPEHGVPIVLDAL